jgi:gp16 family phage-associated protein
MSKTAAEIKEEFRTKGMTLPQWSKQHGYPVRAVRGVLYGHNKGYFGQAHKIAVALGLKDSPK